VISSLSVMIPGEQEPWGVLGAHTTRWRKFTEDDIHFMQAIANLLASSISRARAAQAEREERVFAEALRDTAEALSSTLDLAQVLDRVLENVEKVVPHDAADIMLIEDGAARVVRYRGYAADDIVMTLKDMRLSLTGTVTLRTMVQTLAPLVIDDTYDYPGWVKIPHMEWLRSYLAVPLVAQGSVKGFLNLTSVQPNAFNPQQAERLQAFAAQVIAAIQNAQLYGEALRRADENTLREVAQELRRRI
jgi:GAF domain-containing protein